MRGRGPSHINIYEIKSFIMFSINFLWSSYPPNFTLVYQLGYYDRYRYYNPHTPKILETIDLCPHSLENENFISGWSSLIHFRKWFFNRNMPKMQMLSFIPLYYFEKYPRDCLFLCAVTFWSWGSLKIRIKSVKPREIKFYLKIFMLRA